MFTPRELTAIVREIANEQLNHTARSLLDKAGNSDCSEADMRLLAGESNGMKRLVVAVEMRMKNWEEKK